MITLINLHMLSQENYDRAVAVLKKNTTLRKIAKGFVFRRVLLDVKDPLKGYSLSAWEDREAMRVGHSHPDVPLLEHENVAGVRRVYEKTSSGKVLVFPSTDADLYEIDTEIVNEGINYKTWANRYTQISYHVLHEENREQGLEVLRKNTPIASKLKGFVSRQVYVGADNPLKAYSITTWETLKDLEAFRGAPGRPVITRGDDGMSYEKTKNGPVPVFPQVRGGVFKTIDEAYA